MAQSFENKKVTVMGLGLHGGGVACVLWLVRHGAHVTVTDVKTRKDLVPSLKALGKYSKRVTFVLGRHRISDFTRADVVVQNPGVPRESTFLQAARQNGVVIENDASLFFKYCPCPIIGVTGTRGKSTTSALITALLQKHFGTTKKIWLVGQPQRPMLGVLDRIKPADIVVVELSSWQLEVLGVHRLSPHIAVVTNVFPDHLNRYSSMAEYSTAKENIFKFQKRSDYAILNLDNAGTAKMGRRVPSSRLWFSGQKFFDMNGCFINRRKVVCRRNGSEYALCTVSERALPGAHNEQNILAACAVASIFAVHASTIKSVVATFRGLPGRLELIRELKHIRYINDTTATSPDGTMAALSAIDQNVILIAGGAAKGIPDQKYQELAKKIKETCRAVILFSGQGSQQMERALRTIKYPAVLAGLERMSDAVRIAHAIARPKDTVLLSPANASFGLFVNEYDRGDQFVATVNKL